MFVNASLCTKRSSLSLLSLSGKEFDYFIEYLFCLKKLLRDVQLERWGLHWSLRVSLFFSPWGRRSVVHIQLLQKSFPPLRSLLPVCWQIHCLEERGCHGRLWSEKGKEVSQVGGASPAVHFEFQGSDLELVSALRGACTVSQSTGVKRLLWPALLIRWTVMYSNTCYFFSRYITSLLDLSWSDVNATRFTISSDLFIYWRYFVSCFPNFFYLHLSRRNFCMACNGRISYSCWKIVNLYWISPKHSF